MRLANVAIPVTEASIYYDRAEVPWLMKACEPDATFESLYDPGERRFQGLDTMLATALQAQIKTGELGRALAKKTAPALRKNKLIPGRQIV